MMGVSGKFDGMFGGGTPGIKPDLSNVTLTGAPLNLTNQAYMSPIIGPSSLPYQTQQFSMLNYNPLNQ